jgi:hypothetical protein
MRPAITIATILAFAAGAYAVKDSDRVWKTGKVLDSQTAKTFVQTGFSTQVNGNATTFGTTSSTTVGDTSSGTFTATTTAHGTAETQMHSMTINDTQLLIVADDFLYVVNDSVQKGIGLNGSLARAIGNRRRGCHVIIGDPVQYVDGKGCGWQDLQNGDRPAGASRASGTGFEDTLASRPAGQAS